MKEDIIDLLTDVRHWNAEWDSYSKTRTKKPTTAEEFAEFLNTKYVITKRKDVRD